MTRFRKDPRRQEKTMIDSAQGVPPNPEDDDDQQEPGLHRDTVEDLDPKGEESAGVRGGRTGTFRTITATTATRTI
jgi:hypothetical protein